MVQQFGFELGGIRATLPLGFLEFLQLGAGARLALTDSGGDVHPRGAPRTAEVAALAGATVAALPGEQEQRSSSQLSPKQYLNSLSLNIRLNNILLWNG
jgi:hypothetical protein